MKSLAERLAIACLLSVSIFASFASAQVLAQPLTQQAPAQRQVIARVLMVMGEVATVVGSERSELARGDAIGVGDRIVTGSNGHLHVRFSDNAIVALRPDSEFTVSAYSFGQEARDHVLMELHRGALRAISGEIDSSTYTLKLPAGQVHPESADFRVVVESEDRQLLAVFKGSITADSPAGQLQLGVAAGADYGAISKNDVPELFDEPAMGVAANRISELKLPTQD